MMRLVPLLALLPLAGCAYFNGIYNARQAEQKGDALRRSGRTAEAESVYAIAAAKAESVLVRYPHSRWRGDALFIAGWSWAMAARCSRAEPHLEAFLTRGEVTETALARATLALAACRVQEGEAAQGRALVAPLVHSPDRHLADEAAVWAALASARLGELDSTQAYLRQVAGRPARARAAWMVVSALLERGDLPAAESILVQRAAQGDYQHDLLRTLRALWNAGGAERVARIVERYDSSRISSDDRARLHLLMGELALAAGRDSTARVHLMIARSLARDTVVLQDASAGLTQAELASLTSLVDVANVVARGHERGGGSPIQRRLEDNVLLLQMLDAHEDGTGASLFLAAEVARDSLHAPALARTLFERVAELPRSPLSTKALRAAAQLGPGPASGSGAPRDRVIAAAAFGELVAGSRADSAGADSTDPVEVLLDRTWRAVTAVYADTLRRLRPPLPSGVLPAGTGGESTRSSGRPHGPDSSPPTGAGDSGHHLPSSSNR